MKTSPAAKPAVSEAAARLRQNAEVRLRQRPGRRPAKASAAMKAVDPLRLLHELQVHQIELEMQNAELRQAREALEAALDKYTDLYDFAPAGYFTLTPTGTIRQVNLTGALLLGKDRSRLAGQSFGALVAAGQRPVFQTFLKEVFAREDKQNIDIELAGPGAQLPVVRISAKRSPAGLDCRAVVMDITELKRQEDKVRVSEVRYRRLFEAAQDGVLLLNPDTRKITAANPFITRLLGWPPDRLIGKELFEIGLLPNAAASREMFRNLKMRREIRYDDLTCESRDGRQREVEVAASLYQENGRAVIQCNIRDITERKRAEQLVRASEARYRILFDSGPVAVYSCDASGAIRNFNARAGELWGRQPALGEGGERFSGAFKIFHPDGRPLPHAETPMAQVLKGAVAQVLDQEVIIERPDATRLNCIVNIRPLRDQQGNITGAINCFYDITERKLAENERHRREVLTASNSKLEEEIVRRKTVEQDLKASEQQLRQLSHNAFFVQEEERKRISRELHDTVLQTLVGINVHLKSLTSQAAANPKGFPRKVAHTQRLVGKLMAIVHRFAQELRPSVLDDLGMIPALHTFMKDFMKRTGVRARLTASAAVNELPTSTNAVLYRVALEALNNVAVHAQATQVEVEIKTLPFAVRLTVRDNGKSFDVKRVLRLEGTGRLGLLGMRERLKMVGGAFLIESPPGQGTTVTATIPLAFAGAAKVKKRLPATPPLRPKPGRGS